MQAWQFERPTPQHPPLALGNCRLLSRHFCEQGITITRRMLNLGRNKGEKEVTGSEKIKQMNKP